MHTSKDMIRGLDAANRKKAQAEQKRREALNLDISAEKICKEIETGNLNEKEIQRLTDTVDRKKSEAENKRVQAENLEKHAQAEVKRCQEYFESHA